MKGSSEEQKCSGDGGEKPAYNSDPGPELRPGREKGERKSGEIIQRMSKNNKKRSEVPPNDNVHPCGGMHPTGIHRAQTKHRTGCREAKRNS